MQIDLESELLLHIVLILYRGIEEDKKQLNPDIYADIHIESKQKMIEISEAAIEALSVK